ncbi:hypothetical protein [Qipengyuania sp.]|uniref:hypothetical protein n=1 Tax=Qipengyuania sp. TaxID=2004515 RepID=UPI0035C7E0B7
MNTTTVVRVGVPITQFRLRAIDNHSDNHSELFFAYRASLACESRWTAATVGHVSLPGSLKKSPAVWAGQGDTHLRAIGRADRYARTSNWMHGHCHAGP